jgi:hypothetical protein
VNFHAFKQFMDSAPASAAAHPVIQAEEQNGDYESGAARIRKEQWRIPTARTTPAKAGAFVAVWKRGEAGSTRPFTADESTSGLLVFVEEQERFGVFRFTRQARLPRLSRKVHRPEFLGVMYAARRGLRSDAGSTAAGYGERLGVGPGVAESGRQNLSLSPQNPLLMQFSGTSSSPTWSVAFFIPYLD